MGMYYFQITGTQEQGGTYKKLCEVGMGSFSPDYLGSGVLENR